jgi:PAS domain S-box-containing protein
MPSIFPNAIRGRRELVVIVAVCLAVIAGVWFLSLERTRYEREDAIKDVVRQNTNLALAFEEQTLHAIRRADLTLLHLKREYEREGRIANLHEVAAEGGIDETLVPNLLITDVNGQVLVAHGKTGPVNVADRDFFAVHRQDQTRGLWVAKPLAGRVTGRTVISVSRPLIGPDGAFAGVVAVGLDPNYFLEAYQRFDVGPDGLIQLVGLDGSVRARRQGDKITFGGEMRDSILLRNAAAAPDGSFVSRGQSDGIPRFQSYRVLKTYPLVVSVGTSVDYALAEFHSRERRYYQAAAAATLCVVAFGVVLVFSLRRRRQAIDELAASESLYRATFELAAVGVTHNAPDGRFLKVNAMYSQMLGYSEAELQQRRFHEMIHPEDLPAAEALRKRLLNASEGAPAPMVEHRELRKDGRAIWTSVVVSMVRDAQGAPDYFVAVIEDISARKQAEAREQEAETRYRATFEQAAVGVTHVALDGRFLTANSRLCGMLGYTEAELQSLGFTDITHADDIRPSSEMSERLLGDGRTGSPPFEKRYRRKDGTFIWAMVAPAIVRDPDGKPQYFVTMIQDISAQKAAETQLLEQLDELRRFQRVAVDRELRMIELEAQIRALREKEAA